MRFANSGPTKDHRMVTGTGEVLVAENVEHASWLVVEENARPVNRVKFPWWTLVSTLVHPMSVDPDVYLPGSAL